MACVNDSMLLESGSGSRCGYPRGSGRGSEQTAHHARFQRWKSDWQRHVDKTLKGMPYTLSPSAIASCIAYSHTGA